MAELIQKENALVSVVIPCYNYAHFLPKAIQSILNQTHTNTEIIVVDDGSTDNTSAITQNYPQVKYVYQPNQGLPAARNTGIKYSKGEFILFLDADDWLYPRGIEINLQYLLAHQEIAFVSGLYNYTYTAENKVVAGGYRVEADHYLRLLKGNYICMVATVLFRKRIFEEFLFDTTLTSCEDYELYLRITRKYPVFHHTEKIASYRIHGSNMSTNIPNMLKDVLGVLKKHEQTFASPDELHTFRSGSKAWEEYYSKRLYKKLKLKKALPTKQNLAMLLKYKPKLYVKYFPQHVAILMKSFLKKNAPAFGLRWLHKQGLYKRYLPKVGQVDAGDFLRLTPFSNRFGYDRGGPVDRYYIENFLKQEATSINGHVLEIGDNAYTLQYGGSNVTQSDILHIDATNPAATIIGDLSDAPHIPDNTFDCIILTQTLHLIYDFKAALQTCHRILKPGGTLLLTSPGITPIDHGTWKDTWYWSFTDKALHKLLNEIFQDGRVSISTYGNVFTATAFLYGMGLQEVTKAQLDYNDPHYQVIITVKAVKNAAL